MTAAELTHRARSALAGHRRELHRLVDLLDRGQDPEVAVLTLVEMGMHAAQVTRLLEGGEPLPLKAADGLDKSTPAAAAERAAGRPVVRLHVTEAEAEWQRSVLAELGVLLGKVATLERRGCENIGLKAFQPLRDVVRRAGVREGAA